jgi:hypothetical protein
MGTTQLRHFKLWYAGRSENWALVRYETDQIRDSFEEARQRYPALGDLDLAKMIEIDSYVPLDNLRRAALMKDSRAFGIQFDRLTDACNACHQAAHFGFIKINTPTTSPFSNQTFGFDGNQK